MAQSLDQLAVILACAACCAYVLRCLPAVLVPQGLASLLLALALGAALGLAGAAAVVVYVYFRLTHAASEPGPPRARSPGGQAATQHPRARDITSPGPTMPHAIARGGQFSGTVYTVTLSKWDRQACIMDWPPALPGVKEWKATVSQGTLLLVPTPEEPNKGKSKHAGGKHDGKGSKAEVGEREEAPQPPLRRVGIPLEKCSVEVVRDGLQGRSEMVRRAPLAVTHPRHPLLEGETGFYLFATDPASKQQWLHALAYWCEGKRRLSGLEATYAAYCAATQARALLPYAQEGPAAAVWPAVQASRVAPAARQPHGEGGGGAAAGGAAGGVPGEGRGGRRAAGWRRWGAELRHRVQDYRNRGAAGRIAGTMQHASAPAPPGSPTNGAPATVSCDGAAMGSDPGALPDLDSIIEQRWMQSRKIPVPAVPRAGSRAGSAHGSPTKPPSSRPDDSMHIGSGTPALGSSPTTDSGLALSSEGQVEAAPHVLPGRAPAAAKPAAAGNDDAAAAAGSGPAQSPTASRPAARRLPPELPPLLAPDQFVNMAVTRAAFDLLRNPACQEHMRAHIQRQLSRLNPPDFVQSLEVVSVDMGSTAPTVANFAALPAPDTSVWPQLVFDMRYTGSFSVTIECKVDIRDAPAWSALDKALDRIEGRGGAAAGADCRGGEDGDAGRDGQQGDGGDAEGGEFDLGGLAGGSDSGGSEGTSPTGSSQDQVGVGEGDAECSGSGRGRRRRHFMGQLRHTTANTLRQLAENTASHISKLPLRVTLTFSQVEGTLCAWVPPPPGNRLFWSFLTPPRLSLRAKPQIGGRLLKYAYHASRASAWIQSRLQLSFTKNLVFPGGGDFPLPLLMGVEDPRSADGLPGLEPHTGRRRGPAGDGAEGQRSRSTSPLRPPQRSARGKGSVAAADCPAAAGEGGSGEGMRPRPAAAKDDCDLADAAEAEVGRWEAEGAAAASSLSHKPALHPDSSAQQRAFVQLQLRRGPARSRPEGAAAEAPAL